MSSPNDGVQGHQGQSWNQSWKRTADSGGSAVIRQAATQQRPRIPGCVWKHPKTGGFYWTIKSIIIPPGHRGAGKWTKVPLVAAGRRGATRSRPIAQRVQRRLWNEWSATAAGHVVTPRGVEHWLAEFADFNRLHASDEQAAANCRIVREMMGQASIRGIRGIGDEAVAGYLAALKSAGRSARTIQAHRNSLHKFCRFLVRKGELDANPVDGIEVAAPPKRPPRYLDDWQQLVALKFLSEDLPDWMFDAVLVALYSGARLGSLMALRCEHIKPAGLVMPLPKVGDYSLVPLDSPIIGPQLARILDRVRDGRPGPSPLFPAHTQQWWVARLRKATKRGVAGLRMSKGGWPGRNTPPAMDGGRLSVFGELPGSRAGNQWHLLRSTWAVNCARRGATLWQLMEWGGWKVPTTVLRYVNIARAAGTDTFGERTGR